MNLQSLEQAPGVSDYMKALEYEESGREFLAVPAGKVLLTAGGLLQAGEQAFEVLDEARFLALIMKE